MGILGFMERRLGWSGRRTYLTGRWPVLGGGLLGGALISGLYWAGGS